MNETLLGVSPFFDISVGPDAENSNHSICQIYQGGIGLPDRDYYFDEDKESKRSAYQKHVAKMLTLLADPTTSAEPSEEAAQAAAKVYELERSLAEAHMTKTECRDPHATYNKMTIADLTQRCEGKFNFNAYMEGATGKTSDELGRINVRNTAALERVGLVAATVDPDVLSSYLRWRSVTSCAPYLSKAFVEENFDFFERTLSGTQEIKPRWKRAMAFTESALGEALGQLYCAKHFDEESKERALKIVESVRQALEERLNEVEWMKSATTRDNALKKMSNFRIKIG
jgi:putative endopeptidase